MAREKNDGKGRLGGRQKGTPNKVTSTVKDWLAQLIDNNRKQVERDLKELEPIERLRIIEKLMGYVVPKQQAVSAIVDYDNLTEEQINTIVAEVTKGLEEDDGK